MQLHREIVALNEIVAEAVDNVRPNAPGHPVALKLDPMLGEMNGDRDRLTQVIANLLSNAVKYSPAGGCITLAGRHERHDLVVSVHDQGLGMPAGELDRIFDRFHRVGGDVARQIGGTGLGLAICKGLVEAHGGRIWAESEGEGNGSTFHVTLPVLAEGASEVNRSKGADDHEETNRTRRR